MKKLMITLFMAVLGLAFLGLMAGCPPSTSDDDDDDAGDDDAGDDDAGDDDMGDDDMGDDDAGDDDTWPESPYGFHIDVSFNATSGGASSTTFIHTMIDANQNDLCAQTFELTGTTSSFSAGQGNDYYQWMDEIVTWTSLDSEDSDCPAEWAIYKGDFVEWFMWYMHPLAFVSCDNADANGYAGTFVGEDPTDAGDGTFGGYCDTTGPSVASSLGTGPIEAVWMSPGVSASLDGLGNYEYFAPNDTTNVEVWMIMGLLMADSANTNEPTAGLDGDYLTVPFWLWIYS